MKAATALDSPFLIPCLISSGELLRGSFWITVMRAASGLGYGWNPSAVLQQPRTKSNGMCELMPKLQKYVFCFFFVFSFRSRTWFILLKSRCDWGNAVTGPQSFCLMTLTFVERPINLKHMSKAYMCLLANTEWTPRAELCPKNMAIRGRAVRRNYCLVSFS